MFEKCGLRDIFSKIAKRKWTMLIIIVLCTCIGAGIFLKDSRDYKALMAVQEEEGHKEYIGSAFYYVAVAEGATSNSRIKQMAQNYVSLMKLAPTTKAVYDKLLEKHTEEELIEKLGAYKFPRGFADPMLWKKAYKLSLVNKGYILKLTTYSKSKTMCKELMKVCRNQLEQIGEALPDSVLTFEGEDYTRKTVTGLEDDEKGPASYKTILFGLLIGIAAALLYAVLSAILRPVINRPQDFELYEIRSAGLAGKNSAAIMARLLDKQAGLSAGTIALATTLPKDKAVREFTERLRDEWTRMHDGETGTEGVVLSLAEAPDKSAGASDICIAADKVFTIERKGVTTHRRYDEMINYLELIGKTPEEAVLIR